MYFQQCDFSLLTETEPVFVVMVCLLQTKTVTVTDVDKPVDVPVPGSESGPVTSVEVDVTVTRNDVVQDPPSTIEVVIKGCLEGMNTYAQHLLEHPSHVYTHPNLLHCIPIETITEAMPQTESNVIVSFKAGLLY